MAAASAYASSTTVTPRFADSRTLRFIEAGFALDYVLLDGSYVGRQAEPGPFGHLHALFSMIRR